MKPPHSPLSSWITWKPRSHRLAPHGWRHAATPGTPGTCSCDAIGTSALYETKRDTNPEAQGEDFAQHGADPAIMWPASLPAALTLRVERRNVPINRIVPRTRYAGEGRRRVPPTRYAWERRRTRAAPSAGRARRAGRASWVGWSSRGGLRRIRRR